MSVTNAINEETISTFSSASLLAGYQAVNTSGLSNACFLVRIFNHTKGQILVSFDGITDHEFLWPGRSLEIYGYDRDNDTVSFSKRTKIYVRGTASIGNLYVFGYYRRLN